MDLSKKDMQEELDAINESIAAHEAQITVHEKMLKREKFLKVLVSKELENFK